MRNTCLCFLTEFEFKIMALNRRKCPEKSAVACYREENYAKGCREENYAKRNTWNEIFKDNSLHINYHSQEYRSLNQFSADEFDALRKKKFHLRYVGKPATLPATLYYKGYRMIHPLCASPPDDSPHQLIKNSPLRMIDPLGWFTPRITHTPVDSPHDYSPPDDAPLGWFTP